MLCTAQRFGDEAASELGARQWVGSAALGAHRIREALAIEGDGIEAIAKVFQLHPHFWPRTYVDLRVEITGSQSARLSLGACPALAENDGYSWFAGLGAATHPALDAIAGAINPYARCHFATDSADGLAWDIVIDTRKEPQEEPTELTLARISRGAGWKFEQRRLLRG
jgi:hypothetical protein